jgi:splicing factor 1
MSSTSPEDGYGYEEAGERQAMVKNLHVPIKLWYNSNNCKGMQEKYGAFPMFWQDLDGWAGFKHILKLYMYVSDREQLHDTLDLETLEQAVAEKGDSSKPPPTTDSSAEPPPVADASAGDDARKRRRNRWGVGPEGGAEAESAAVPEPSGSASAAADEEALTKRRKSRWSVAAAEPAAGAGGIQGAMLAAARTSAPMLSHEAIQQTMVYQMQLKQINESLATVVQDALTREADPNRSPSPPPRYDGQGKRVNTREYRMREDLNAARTRLIEDLMKLNPLYQAPSDYVKVKPFKKIYIPNKEHPNYNFIGLIIGPRGSTQRSLEKDSGARVSIRGKGSVKEGRKNQVKGPDDDDDLHVHIHGESEEAVAIAVRLVEELLVVVDDEKNEHKQKQLRELALINGTLREDEFCQVCGERGHKQFECPHRSKTFKAANVKCAICGEQSHPTRDCPLKESGPTNEVALDSEYTNFMAELEGKPVEKKVKAGSAYSSHAPGDGAGDSAELSKEENGVVTTERILNGNRKQTIIHSKTLMTGWSATPQAQAAPGAGAMGNTPYWPGAQPQPPPYGAPSAYSPAPPPAPPAAAWNADTMQYSQAGMYQTQGGYGGGAYGAPGGYYPPPPQQQQQPPPYYGSAVAYPQHDSGYPPAPVEPAPPPPPPPPSAY